MYSIEFTATDEMCIYRAFKLPPSVLRVFVTAIAGIVTSTMAGGCMALFLLLPQAPLCMDMLLKKDVGQSNNHATSNTPWVSG
jgi:hypothetical protein